MVLLAVTPGTEQHLKKIQTKNTANLKKLGSVVTPSKNKIFEYNELKMVMKYYKMHYIVLEFKGSQNYNLLT